MFTAEVCSLSCHIMIVFEFIYEIFSENSYKIVALHPYIDLWRIEISKRCHTWMYSKYLGLWCILFFLICQNFSIYELIHDYFSNEISKIASFYPISCLKGYLNDRISAKWRPIPIVDRLVWLYTWFSLDLDRYSLLNFNKDIFTFYSRILPPRFSTGNRPNSSI